MDEAWHTVSAARRAIGMQGGRAPAAIAGMEAGINRE